MLFLSNVMHMSVSALKTNSGVFCRIAWILQSATLVAVVFLPAALKLAPTSTTLKLLHDASSAPSPQSATPSQIWSACKHTRFDLQTYEQLACATGIVLFENDTVAAKA